MRERQKGEKKEEEKDKELLNCLHSPELSQPENEMCDLSVVLSCGWWGFSCLSHQYWLPSLQQQKAGIRIEAGT